MSHTNLIYQARLVLVALLQGAPQGAISIAGIKTWPCCGTKTPRLGGESPSYLLTKRPPSTIMENAGVAGFPALQLLTQVFQLVSAGDSIRSAIACS